MRQEAIGRERKGRPDVIKDHTQRDINPLFSLSKRKKHRPRKTGTRTQRERPLYPTQYKSFINIHEFYSSNKDNRVLVMQKETLETDSHIHSHFIF